MFGMVTAATPELTARSPPQGPFALVGGTNGPMPSQHTVRTLIG
jgi:hypothetical protein